MKPTPPDLDAVSSFEDRNILALRCCQTPTKNHDSLHDNLPVRTASPDVPAANQPYEKPRRVSLVDPEHLRV